MKIFPYPHAYPNQIRDESTLLKELNDFKHANDQNGFFGTLAFTALTHAYDNWDLGHLIASDSHQIPLMAILPFYENPVITARKIVSFQAIYQRPLAINWISGLALNDYEKLGLKLTKVQRYAMLKEHITVVNALLDPVSKKTLTFEGEFFYVKNHKLQKNLSFPLYQYISGTSAECLELIREFKFLNQLVGGMEKGHTYSEFAKGAAFGVVVRPSELDAKKIFDKKFKSDSLSLSYAKLAQKNTDSDWKLKIHERLKQEDSKGNFFYSSISHYSEVGFVVGDYIQVSEYFKNLISLGMSTFVVCLLDCADIYHLRKCIDLI